MVLHVCREILMRMVTEEAGLEASLWNPTQSSCQTSEVDLESGCCTQRNTTRLTDLCLVNYHKQNWTWDESVTLQPWRLRSFMANN